MSAVLKKIQVIHALNGEPEYVLVPYNLYQALRSELERKHAITKSKQTQNYVAFRVEDYVDNPIALARIKARISQTELARRLKVSQAYISKVERQDHVTPKLLARVDTALRRQRGKRGA
ncbi:MAG: helix-turn-helix transcriptional regulator [Gammaproteobacteria bacterium]